MPENISLIGFMGCGKTTIGRSLAARLEWEFIDTDQLIVQTAHRSIPEIFAAEGEASFRKREAESVQSACAGKGRVIATGGGAVMRMENTEQLRASSLVIWLTARADVIVQRTRHNAASRPLLAKGADDPLLHVLTLLGERAPYYQRAAHLIVDTSDRTPAALVSEIIRKWEKQLE